MSENFERTLLLVDNDHDYLEWASKHLKASGLRILRCDDADKAEKVCQKTDVDLVIADMQIEPFDGSELLKRLKARYPNMVVILTAGFPGTAQIIKASQAGAHDILGKEGLTFELRPAVENGFETVDALVKTEELPQQKKEADGRLQIIGNSKSFQDVFKIVGRVARTNAPVLVSGGSGTGKELVATSFHAYSNRRKNELVAIRMACMDLEQANCLIYYSRNHHISPT